MSNTSPGESNLSRPNQSPPGVLTVTPEGSEVAQSRPTQTPPQTPTTQFTYSSKGAENPFEEGVAAARGGANLWGACSIENFCNGGSLSYTHEDAKGWLDYLRQFAPENFWRQDGNVKIWLYTEPYDHWLDTYGVDAVRAFYHSGHGGMDANGVFYVPLGGSWSGNNSDCTVNSNQMHYGESPLDRANYIFWSTCLSCRVLDGQNPLRTWSPVNGGFRMLFGFETTSWDSPDYGSNFWKEWNVNKKSFSTAWLDASWDIAHDQAPSCVACGATAQEAQDRVFNERLLYPDHVSTAWFWWRWYYAATAAIALREPQLALPRQLQIARLQPPVEVNEQRLRAIMDRVGLEMRVPAEIVGTREGDVYVADGDVGIGLSGAGSFDVRLARPNRSNRTQLPLRQARSIAEEAIRRYGLAQQGGVTFDRIRLSSEGGSTTQGDGQVEGPYITETTVQFRQVINGLPVLTPGAGTVRVTLDNDARVTGVHSSVRPIDRLMDRPLNTTADPPLGPAVSSQEPRPIGQARATDVAGIEDLLAQQWAQQMAFWVMRGSMPLQYTVVPGSTEVGYDIRGNNAIIVARRAIEVDFGNGYLKRYWVVAPLFG
jgi:hypothetical protein